MPVVRGSTVLTLRPQRLLPSGCPNVEPRRGNRGGGIGKFTHKGPGCVQLSVGPGSVAPIIPAINVRGDRLDQAICAVPLGMVMPDVLYHSSRPGVVAQVPKRRFSGADWPLNNQVVEGLND